MINTYKIASNLVDTARHSDYDHKYHSADDIKNLMKNTYHEIDKKVTEEHKTPQDVINFMTSQDVENVEDSAKFLAGAVYLFKHGKTSEGDLLKIVNASVDQPAKAVFMGAIAHVLCNMKQAAESPGMIADSLCKAAEARNFSHGDYNVGDIERDIERGRHDADNGWFSYTSKGEIIDKLRTLDLGNIREAARFAGGLDKATDRGLIDKHSLNDVLLVMGCMGPNAVFGGTIAKILMSDD